MRQLLLISAILFCPPCWAATVQHAGEPPCIDGRPDDSAWSKARWRPLDKRILGSMPTADDFSGRYKIVWTREALFLLAEISDDVLIDTHANPVERYWDDDMLEIFIDEDASGGDHLYNFNAFAYHVSLDNQVADLVPAELGGPAMLFPGHVHARWQRDAASPNRLYWEMRIVVHDDSFDFANERASRVNLHAGKTIGFMVAYGDADTAAGREHFMGDVEIEPVNGDRNRGYIDAGVFARITLIDDKKE